MPKDSITLSLTGEVPLSVFAEAMDTLSALVDAVYADVAKDAKINWVIESLEGGSAIATIQGIPLHIEDRPKVELVVETIERAERAAARRDPIPYSPRVSTSLLRLHKLAERAETVSLATDDEDFPIYRFDEPTAVNAGRPAARPKTASPGSLQGVYGSVRGRVQSMSNRGRLRFTLYDIVDDNAVICYLEPGCEDIMLNAWGKLAIVEGRIRRDPASGRPLTVREARNVEILPEAEKWEWQTAFGCVPRDADETMTPEEAIRRVRDGR